VRVVVGLNLCPFAKTPLEQDRVRFAEARGTSPHELLADLLHECAVLDTSGLSTSLLVLPEMPFEDYLDLYAAAEDLVPEAYQLASFHPDYVFADAEPDDPANGTNRAPHPVIHLLRRAEVAEAIARHPDTASIPERNAALLRSLLS